MSVSYPVNLGIEPGSSGSKGSALNRWTISPGPEFVFLS